MNTTMTDDYARIERAIRYLDERYREQPNLAEVARHVGLNELQLQRLFTRWAGISPKRFLQFVTAGYARDRIRARRSLLDATYDVGLSGPGRLHDLIVAVNAVTPGEWKAAGRGLEIRWGVHDSPFGRCLVAVTERGICGLNFLRTEEARGAAGEKRHAGAAAVEAEAVAALAREWPHAVLRRDPASTRPIADRIFALDAGLGNGGPGDGGHGGSGGGGHAGGPGIRGDGGPGLSVLLKGTNFQIRVWEALLRIPLGEVASYEDVAEAIGAPTATRAVGNAVGRNPVPFLIPCHRVIRKTGAFGYYGGGVERKKAILAWESVRSGRGGAAESGDGLRPAEGLARGAAR